MKKNLALILCPPLWAMLPPAGIAYLAESAEQAGHKVFVYDLNVAVYNRIAGSYQKDWTINPHYLQQEFCAYCIKEFEAVFANVLSGIKVHNIQYVGFSLFRSNRCFTFSLAERIKTQYPDVKIILGGPEVFTLKTEGLPEHGPADYFVIGEGEEPLLSILEDAPARVYAFRQQSALNCFPRYRAFDLSLYRGRGRLPVVASRGCINGCTFCTERLLFKNYRCRAASHVMREIIYHYAQHGTRHFVFYDSLFNGSLERLESLLDLLIGAGLKISWEAQVYIREDMPDLLFSKIKQSGCVNLFIGLESGADNILKKMNKRFNTEKALHFLQKLYNAGLQYEIALIVNYPGEEEGEFLQTMDFIRNHKHLIKKIAQVNTFKQYPGTAVSLPLGYNAAAGREKIQRLIRMFTAEGIPYTASYIENLV